MVLAGAFLKFFDTPRERRVRNTYLYWFGFFRDRRQDFYFPPPYISLVVLWDVESHEVALSLESSAELVDWSSAAAVDEFF